MRTVPRDIKQNVNLCSYDNNINEQSIWSCSLILSDRLFTLIKLVISLALCNGLITPLCTYFQDIMLRFVLLGAVLISLVVGRSEPEERGCRHNMMFLKVGKKVYRGCEECRCMSSGKQITI